MIDMSDGSSSERPLRLVVPAPTPSPSGNSDDIFHPPTPSPSGNGGDIFHHPTRRRPAARETSINTPAALSASANFSDHLHHLNFRNPDRECKRSIYYPAENEIGDANAWYYVTVGRTVGVFNTW